MTVKRSRLSEVAHDAGSTLIFQSSCNTEMTALEDSQHRTRDGALPVLEALAFTWWLCRPSLELAEGILVCHMVTRD